MDYKDPMGDEIKSIFEEETLDIEISNEILDNIMKNRKLTLKEKIRDFLNKEVEIPLTPAIIGFVLILGISMFPKDFPTTKNVEIINFNGSQIIMKTDKEVGRK